MPVLSEALQYAFMNALVRMLVVTEQHVPDSVGQHVTEHGNADEIALPYDVALAIGENHDSGAGVLKREAAAMANAAVFAGTSSTQRIPTIVRFGEA